MNKPIISYAGYVFESSFRKRWLGSSFDDYGKIRIDKEGIRFEGKQGWVIVPLSSIKKVDFVYKDPGKLGILIFIALNLLMAFSYIIHQETSFNWWWFILAIVMINMIVFFMVYRSSWVRVSYTGKTDNEVRYFSVVWNIGISPKWRFFKDSSLLSYLDNKRIVEEIQFVITALGNDQQHYSKKDKSNK